MRLARNLKDPAWLLQMWDRFIETPRSVTRRTLGSVVIAVGSIVVMYVLHRETGHYFSAIPVVAATLVTLYAGYFFGFIIAVLVALIADFLFLPPIGSVLEGGPGYLHLGMIIFLTVFMSALVASLRAALNYGRVARQTAQEAANAIEGTLSIISHDLRNSITTSRLNAELIPRFVGDRENLATVSSSITSAMNEVDQMIQDLLNVHRSRAGVPFVLERAPCDVRLIAEEVVRNLNMAHGERFVLVAHQPIQGNYSGSHLRRAIENLAINAFKYGSATDPIRIGVNEDSREVRIFVHNFGNPIPPEDQENIFEPFHRALSVNAARNNGWGLGLASVSQIAKGHGGNVSLVSNASGGTTFTIHLPKQAS